MPDLGASLSTAMNPRRPALRGAGLGLRRAFLDALAEQPPTEVDFYEIAPENWIGLGGHHARRLRLLTERHPFVAHGLSLSIGGPTPLDLAFVRRLKGFLDQHGIQDYSEHLSYCADAGQLYELLPIPFTEEAVVHVASRVRQVQDILERPIALENVSYYAAPGQRLSEIDFIRAVLTEADCDLLLDVNNIHVNAVNHGYDPRDFLAGLPGERIRYIHVAGHYHASESLLIDTHGADVIDPVWALLEAAYRLHGVFPTLLERDFNIPPLADLLREVTRIARLQQAHRAPVDGDREMCAGAHSASEPPDFIQRQLDFAAHLRDPEQAPPPEDVAPERLAVYRELVFDNLSQLLGGAFPVLRGLLPDDRWRALIRDFLIRHRARSPLFPELPGEFLDHLRAAHADTPPSPPFLLELAHYEWVELALRISDAAPDPADLDPDGDLMRGTPVLSPLAWNLTYRFPVQRIGPSHQPETPPAEPTHLLVHRTPDDRIAFLEINAVTQRLLILIQTEPASTGRELLTRIAGELGHPDPDRLVAFGARLLADLRARGVLLGTRVAQDARAHQSPRM